MSEGPVKEGYSEGDEAYLASLGLDADARAQLKKVSDDAMKGANEEMERRAQDPYEGLRSGMPDPIE